GFGFCVQEKRRKGTNNNSSLFLIARSQCNDALGASALPWRLSHANVSDFIPARGAPIISAALPRCTPDGSNCSRCRETPPLSSAPDTAPSHSAAAPRPDRTTRPACRPPECV